MAIHVPDDPCPEAVARYAPPGQTFLSAGAEYEVYALVSGDLQFLQIIDDQQSIVWTPSWFFEVTDPSIPRDWICSFTPGTNEMRLGPPFVAADYDAYVRMVELDPASRAAFWRRHDAMLAAARRYRISAADAEVAAYAEAELVSLGFSLLSSTAPDGKGGYQFEISFPASLADVDSIEEMGSALRRLTEESGARLETLEA